MVQCGIFLRVIVMKRNRKIVVPSIRGGLRASCCGKGQEVQVRTGTSAEEYICIWILLNVTEFLPTNIKSNQIKLFYSNREENYT